MTPYMRKSLGKTPEEITMTAPMPTTENLFKVLDERYGIPLPEKICTIPSCCGTAFVC